MSTIADPAARAELKERLRRLAPEATPAWGAFTAPRMVCHLTDQLRVGLGEIPGRDRRNLIAKTLIRWLVIHTSFNAPPGKVKTNREMLTTSPGDWEADLASCEAKLDRLATEPNPAPHPSFGRLSAREWQVLAWKHFDHHLRQFRV